ncbi:AzlC family ABC transporter permease [Amphritea japonica]|uniref:Branched-chain amino acid exporter, LIV-E family n=1 Tax=Amphritea japonica ATCC BAA-1530 TaxID=1278309 RepID=A0A7R6PM56_9GAMM|nr:AzlC family ABC transporter permease [Amphritea japonica]BBB26855.1 branched-chain amino acid exporter, LIV-E family [Amphritea japonica ATCC BAA-1530]
MSSQILSQTVTAIKRREMLDGAKATLPLIVGAIPFGIIFGTLAGPSGLSAWGALAMSVIVFAGSAQFIALGLMAAGAAIPVIIATTFVVNLRHILYAANLVPKVRHLPQRWRLMMAFGLTDETFAAVSNRFLLQENTTHAHWFYLGSWLAMYSNWVLCTGLGIGLGELFPDMTHWGLDFAMSVTFIGMVVPYLKSKPMWGAVIVAAAMAMATLGLPHKLGLMVAAICGISTGLSMHLLLKRNSAQEPSHE